jgi:hypothetical protein
MPPVTPVIEVMSAFAPEAAALRLVRAVLASVAPVPPLATASVPAIVIVPEEVIGPPDVVRPVVPPETSTEVTVPAPAVSQTKAEPFHFKNLSDTVGASIKAVVFEFVL